MDTTVSTDRLELRDDKGRVSRVALASARLIIGRAEDADVRIDHVAVSRRHAELACDPFGRWWVRDLKSHNGTQVNGVVVTEHALGYKDAVEIGPFTLRLCPAACLSTTTCTISTTTASAGGAPFERITSLDDASVPRLGAAHLDVLAEFARRLRETPDPVARLGALCQLAVSIPFHGRMAAAVRVERAQPDKAAILCGPACPPGAEGRMPYVSRSLIRAVIERNQPVMGSNVSRGGANLELTAAADIAACAALACPLCSDTQAVEFLYVLLPPEFGSAEWLSLVSLAVGEFQQASLAWLSRRQSEDHSRIEKDLERAHEIQSRLIPRDVVVPGLDVAVGFEPCRWVGGDYVDVVPLRDGRAFLTVADVCGKGMQAALIASGVHGRVHAAIESGMEMHEAMLGVNRYLREFLPGDSFVTMCAILIAPAAGEMHIINAGHPAPIVVDASGGVRELESGLNPPLGVADRLEPGIERLDAGEVLAMFTDGWVEVGEMRDVGAGVRRMGDWLRAASVEATLAAAAARLLGMLAAEDAGSPAADDRSFLLARRLG